jgi:hypothetical protein
VKSPLNRRGIVEDAVVIDVNRFRRDGLLVSGSSGQSRLADSEIDVPVEVSVESDARVISVSIARGWIYQEIALTRTPGTYGGERVWFECPSNSCSRRAVRLYLTAAMTFRCRICADLRYESQGYRAPRRAAERAKAIRRRLGGRGVLLDPFPPRPSGMHRKTYARLRAAARSAEQEFALDLSRREANLLSRLDRSLAKESAD